MCKDSFHFLFSLTLSTFTLDALVALTGALGDVYR